MLSTSGVDSSPGSALPSPSQEALSSTCPKASLPEKHVDSFAQGAAFSERRSEKLLPLSVRSIFWDDLVILIGLCTAKSSVNLSRWRIAALETAILNILSLDQETLGSVRGWFDTLLNEGAVLRTRCGFESGPTTGRIFGYNWTNRTINITD